MINDDMRDMIMNNASTDRAPRRPPRTKGMVTLRDAGMAAMFDGSDHRRGSDPRNDYSKPKKWDELSQPVSFRRHCERHVTTTD